MRSRTYFTSSKSRVAVASGKRLKKAWDGFLRCMEKTMNVGVIWIEYEAPHSSSIHETFVTLVRRATELPILSRTYLASFETYIQCLTALRNANSQQKERLKRTEGVTALKAVLEGGEDMWTRFCTIFEAVTYPDDEEEKSHDEIRSVDETEDHGDKKKLKALKKMCKMAEKALFMWETIGKSEEEHVRVVREWWRRDWLAHLKYATTEETPAYLHYLDAWHTHITSPQTAATAQSMTTALQCLVQTLAHQLSREQGATVVRREILQAGKKAKAASRQNSRRKVTPDGMSSANGVGGMLDMTHKRRVSRKLHVLDTARYKLKVTLRNNREFACQNVFGSICEMWACARDVAVVMRDGYAQSLRIGKDDQRRKLKRLSLERPDSAETVLAIPTPPEDSVPISPAMGKRASRWRRPSNLSICSSVQSLDINVENLVLTERAAEDDGQIQRSPLSQACIGETAAWNEGVTYLTSPLTKPSAPPELDMEDCSTARHGLNNEGQRVSSPTGTGWFCSQSPDRRRSSGIIRPAVSGVHEEPRRKGTLSGLVPSPETPCNSTATKSSFHPRAQSEFILRETSNDLPFNRSRPDTTTAAESCQAEASNSRYHFHPRSRSEFSGGQAAALSPDLKASGNHRKGMMAASGSLHRSEECSPPQSATVSHPRAYSECVSGSRSSLSHNNGRTHMYSRSEYMPPPTPPPEYSPVTNSARPASRSKSIQSHASTRKPPPPVPRPRTTTGSSVFERTPSTAGSSVGATLQRDLMRLERTSSSRAAGHSRDVSTRSSKSMSGFSTWRDAHSGAQTP
ncbi:hypothetical protein BC832DRAFT_391427 [Gaertneriomyces semiglobifer]|nr:hypothetical protein BC832DRAFT_391427 [Gaertneriomyces semiglobifer]